MHLRDTFFIKSNTPIIKIDTSKVWLTAADTIRVKYEHYVSKKENKIGFIFDKKQKEKYNLKAFPGGFSDLYAVKNDTLSFNFRTQDLEDYGRITMDIINTSSENLIVELLSGKENDQVVGRRYITTSETLVFDLLEPKSYTVRAIIDANKNNKWDTGSYLLKILPENVLYYTEELEVRANYFLEGNTFTIENPK